MREFERIVKKRVLATRVLAVAVVNFTEDDVFDWTAYCDSVPGIHHYLEKEEVARTGDKLPIEIAKVLFRELPEEKFRG